jgi:hypothetical protein
LIRSLKSATILMDAAREFRNPNLMGVVFRESYPNLQDLIKKAYRLYSGYPYLGDYNKAERIWRFPTNAKELADLANIEAAAHKRIVPVYDDGQCAQILFRHMANDDDVHNYQSFEFSFTNHPEMEPVAENQRKSFQIRDDYPAELRSQVDAIIESPGFYRNLPPVPGSRSTWDTSSLNESSSPETRRLFCGDVLVDDKPAIRGIRILGSETARATAWPQSYGQATFTAPTAGNSSCCQRLSGCRSWVRKSGSGLMPLLRIQKSTKHWKSVVRSTRFGSLPMTACRGMSKNC